MKTKMFVLGLLLLHVGGQSQAADPERNDSPPSPMGLIITGSRLREMPIEMRERPHDFISYAEHLSRFEMDRRLRDGANPIRMRFFDLVNHDPNTFAIGQGIVTSSIQHAFEDAAMHLPIVDSWLNHKKDWVEGWIKDLVRSILDESGEEDIRITGNAMSQYSTKVWMEEVESGQFKRGIELLRWPNPYIYMSGGLGRNEGERILLWHVRVYALKFQSARLEALLSMPLPEKFYLSSGVVYVPLNDYRLGQFSIATARIEKWFDHNRGEFFVGTELSRGFSIVSGLSLAL